MAYLVDTCGWIEWFAGDGLAQSFGRYLKQPAELVVPTIVQMELYKWICREKNEALALEVIGITEQGTVVPLDTPLALYAANLAGSYKLAMADAIIYATSKQYNAPLITADKHFKNLPNVSLLI